MSLKTARANPQLQHSWIQVTTGIAILTVVLLLSIWRIEDAEAVLRCAPTMILCIVWQASDVFWHLGLNRRPQTRQLYQSIGWANIFTLVRGVGTAFLSGRYIGGLATPTMLLLVVFLLGVVTDILDGWVARRTQTVSRLGQMLDAETDFCQYLIVTLLLLQNQLLPAWVIIVFLLRFCLPLLAALGSYFLLAQPVRISSTQWGKLTGVVQGCYLLVLMLPGNFQSINQILQTPLLIATLILLIGAPIAQLFANRRTSA
jgi:phosphatidylglycerophosphate synthase